MWKRSRRDSPGIEPLLRREAAKDFSHGREAAARLWSGSSGE